ncbi:MAG: dihydroorotate dehydrogenase [Candidatus Bathyarchaeota archaeon]|jgi:dihydroorotate dehydrogenase (NAD+) catalytic subunit|nr:dihydroorotate dehydrogenase [Candidatus Bathyarchaeota archaeon]
MPNQLAVEIAGLKLSNPTMLAAGILGMTAASLKEAFVCGAGAVVTKSVGVKPRDGYPNPTVAQVDSGLINAMGLPNPSINEFKAEIKTVKQEEMHIPLIVSIYGFSVSEFVKAAEVAVEAGADALELNVSCPHVKETGAEIGQNPDLFAEVVSKVRRNVEKPVFVKLTPNVSDIVGMARIAVQAGADALAAINTVRAMAIDVETTRPILANKIGGLSGPAIKPIAIKCVYEIHREVDIPIVGCGGIASWQDAIEFMLAGASAIQVGTAIATRGLGVFQSITRGINSYLKRKGFRSVKEIVGLSHSS